MLPGRKTQSLQAVNRRGIKWWFRVLQHTRGKDLTAHKQLKDMGAKTTKPTNKGTIAKLEEAMILNPNFKADKAVATVNPALKLNSDDQR
jgi:hypothetical protein|tara:strand:+ start:1860 stop:2129 length:270 start_codon:yes stop_codon:yes gene_type:complete